MWREKKGNQLAWRIRKKKEREREERVCSLIISGWWCWDTRQLMLCLSLPFSSPSSLSLPRRDEKGWSFLFLFESLSFSSSVSPTRFFGCDEAYHSASPLFLHVSLSLCTLLFSCLCCILAYLYHAGWVLSLSLHFPSIFFALLHTGRPAAARLFLCLNKWQLAAATTTTTTTTSLLLWLRAAVSSVKHKQSKEKSWKI